jgi:hypothetical protein
LIAVAFTFLALVVIYSIATGRPIYINGEPWGVADVPVQAAPEAKAFSDAASALTKRVELIEALPKFVGCSRLAQINTVASGSSRTFLTRGSATPKPVRPGPGYHRPATPRK